jgi:protein O-GlcNAc transferase
MTAATLDPLPLRRALADTPHQAVAWQRLGLILAAGGDVASAVTPLRRATNAAPALPAPWENLGLAFGVLGRWPEAAAAYGNAFNLRSDRVDLASRLADALGKAGRPADAAQTLDRAIALSPADPGLRRERGLALAMSGEVARAVGDLRAALAGEPGSAPLHYTLGQCQLRLAQSAAAERRYRCVLALDAQSADALINLGVLAQAHDGMRARRLFRRSIALSPMNATAHSNLALVDMGLGRMDEAVPRLRRAVGIAPDWVDAHSNLLLALGYTDVDADRYFTEHRHWEARHAKPAYAFIRSSENVPDPERRLRVGYLSADFFDHALGTNMDGLIRHHDRSAVEVTCYAEIGRPDDTTRHFREIADRFVETQMLDDAALAERIRADGIDILVVLAGHTARNRLTVAGRKPAPILVSYADFSTTGLAVMDYWLTDPVVHPEGAIEERFTETLMRIPMMVLHRPIEVAPPVSPLPARVRGHVTFGSYNNPAKIGDRVIDLWARVLGEVPQSRLMLKYRKVYDVPDVRSRLAQRFAERGIDPVRIVFAGGDLDRATHLALVGEMDIALDPFPFNGCTTTFEALWMGVPVVTLAGRRFLGRMGTSFLTHLGMPDLVADTPEAYVRIAAALAGDLDRLAALRQQFRERILASPLCDGPAYARSIEKAFREAWRRWCEARQ